MLKAAHQKDDRLVVAWQKAGCLPEASALQNFPFIDRTFPHFPPLSYSSPRLLPTLPHPEDGFLRI